jgi:hypothetical protein
LDLSDCDKCVVHLYLYLNNVKSVVHLYLYLYNVKSGDICCDLRGCDLGCDLSCNDDDESDHFNNCNNAKARCGRRASRSKGHPVRCVRAGKLPFSMFHLSSISIISHLKVQIHRHFGLSFVSIRAILAELEPLEDLYNVDNAQFNNFNRFDRSTNDQ